MDLTSLKRAKLKQIFPSVFYETLNDKGELVESIDFEKLKAELGMFSDVFESRSECYGMDWPGKRDCLKLAQQPSTGTLKPCREESINFDITENLFIEGDNLEVLKLLQKSYYGKIKMIYIDPPYNTGKELIYSDNFTQSLEAYQAYAGTITPDEGRFHTKWLNMIYPRLYLARNLLRQDGLIFISIDDHEVCNLRKICDEIFGEEEFVENIVWLNKEGGGGSDSRFFRKKHEYICVYAKNKSLLTIKGVEVSNKNRYKMTDDYVEERGPYYLQKLAQSSIQYSKNLDYPIRAPDGTEVYPGKTNGKKNCYRWSKGKVQWGIENGFVVFKKDNLGNWQVYTKQYLHCDNQGNYIERTNRPPAVIESYSTTQASKYFKSLFGKEVFKYSKPCELIKHLIKISTSPGDYILDFFSGSCTTAHAVIDINKEDGGNRRFIMVQLPEPCKENSEPYKAGYKTIADIGKERIRRVIKTIKEEKAQLDLGFKVFKLDKPN